MQKALSFGVTLLLFLLALHVNAQSDTIYFDAQWDKTTRDKAIYFRLPPKKVKGLYKVEDRYMSGKLQMTGSFSQLDPDVKEGYFIFYDSLGYKESEGMCHKGKNEGNWKGYFKGSDALKSTSYFVNDTANGASVWYDSASHLPLRQGQVKSNAFIGKWSYFFIGTRKLSYTMEFDHGVKDGAFVGYDSVTGKVTARGQLTEDKRNGMWQYYDAKTGKLHSEENYWDDTLNGVYKLYDTTGLLVSECTYKNEVKQGEQKNWYPVTHVLRSIIHYKDGAFDGELLSYYPNGNKRRVEHYADNKRIDSVCYRIDGSEEPYYPFLEKPSFPGVLSIFTETYAKYPSAALAVKKGGLVFIEFSVDEQGNILNASIIKGIGGTCDEAALTFVARMPQWNPGKLDGNPTRMKARLAVNFLAKQRKIEAEQF